MIAIDAALPHPVRRVRVTTALLVASPYVGATAGAWALVLSYRAAADGDSSLAPFHLFWLGILLFLIPTSYRLLGLTASRSERLALVAATGAYLFLPKLLRDPRNPLYYDELAHWRQSEAISAASTLFQPNPIVRIAEYFPGLDAVNVGLQRMTGMSTLAAGTAMLVIAHAVALIGVFRLGERLLGSARLGGLAALVYALNTSFIFFDSQYAYESLAIVFFIWSLACTAEALAAAPGAARLGWTVAAFVAGVACVVTHHLSSYALVAALACITLACFVLACRNHARVYALSTSVCLTLGLGAMAGVWILVVAPDIIGYLGPDIQRGFAQIGQVAQRSGGSRQLFSQTLLPSYERIAAYLAPVLSLALAVSGVWTLRRQLFRDNGALLGLTVFGSIYFLSLPFILTQGGAEGARRSWAFTSLGLCLVVAVGLAGVADRARRTRIRGGGAAAVAALLAAIATIAVGNTASGVNAEYRFPGAFTYGSDARTVTAETRGAVNWLTVNAGTQQRTIADRDTGLAFGTLGSQWIERAWAGLPLWQFYFRADQPDTSMLRALRQAGTRYLVVDRRMAQDLPHTGVYFVPDEPGARRHKKPVPEAALDKFSIAPWAIEIYSTDHYRIYRLDLGLLGTCSDDARKALGGPHCVSAQ